MIRSSLHRTFLDFFDCPSMRFQYEEQTIIELTLITSAHVSLLSHTQTIFVIIVPVLLLYLPY
jgi:hypothetical protein